MKRTVPAIILALSCTTSTPGAHQVAGVIDAWHAAAARADEAAYFDLLTDDAIFLGTDSSERWTKTAFREFVNPYFSTGRGWTYTPRDRSVYFSADGRVAWFEEKLDNEKYGELRGTGVLRRTGPSWKIAHYSMSFPVPNDRTEGVVRVIRGE